MTKRNSNFAKVMHAVGAVSLVLTYAMVGVFTYWYFMDMPNVVTVRYSHPFFVSRPVDNVRDAHKYTVKSAKVGQTLYRYVEYDVTKEFDCDINRRWTNGFVFQVPTTSNIARPGSYKRSFAVTVPPAHVNAYAVYTQELQCRINPVKTVSVHSQPIGVWIIE